MHINGSHRWLLAEQMATRMDGKLRNKMSPETKAGLTQALVRNVPDLDKGIFGNNPFRPTPPRWNVAGLIARVTQQWRQWHEPRLNNDEDGFATYSRIRSSGVVALIVTVLMMAIIGLSDFGRPAEIGLQIGRDAIRPVAASGDIVMVAMDNRSESRLGRWPWPRRHDAALVDRLREMGAKRIVYNVIFPDSTNRADDNALAAAFDRANGKVWLAAHQEMNSRTGEYDPVLPLPLFRNRTQQGHIWLFYNLFGNVEKIYGVTAIGGQSLSSQAEALAGKNMRSAELWPDTAIDYKSIPTFSAIDVINGDVAAKSIAGKTIMIAVTSDTSAIKYPILGQGRAVGAYSWVIAAETIKNGPAREMGFVLPLLLIAGFGLACTLKQARRARVAMLGGGMAVLILMTVVGDRLGYHFTIVPALLGFIILGLREFMRGKVAAALMTHPVSGLPNLSHLNLIRGYDKCVPVAVMIERFPFRVETLRPDEQRALTRAIAARINIIAPRHLVHQGDGGIFVFLVDPDDPACDLDLLPMQLRALFTFEVFALYGAHDVGMDVGICYDRGAPFATRLALSIDRARRGAYTVLRAVV
jgi:diguanylate cyclase